MTFAKLKTTAGDPIWINEYGVVLREPSESEWHDDRYKGELTAVIPTGESYYIVRGAPEEIAQVIDNDRS